MDINELIKREAGSDSEHDKYYAEALKEAFQLYDGENKEKLLELQQVAREKYRHQGSTHHNVASCMVIMELLKEL